MLISKPCVTLRPVRSAVKMSSSTRVLQCNPVCVSFRLPNEQPNVVCQNTMQALQEVSHHLLHLLQPVAFLTETVYGLGTIALDASAASRIFSVKGRPPDNPLIVHISSFAMLHSIFPKGYKLSKSYQVLTKHFWPGALTLLFPNNPDLIPPIITANQSTVAIRMLSLSECLPIQ
jgi:L-threonylcarbamoyladenylate synthase